VTLVGGRFRAIPRIEARAATVRRIAIWALAGLGAASIALACWSLAEGGIGWDSRGDTIAALVTRSVDSSEPLAQAYEDVPVTSEFYGVLPQQLADVLHTAVTGSTAPLGPDEPSTYLYQGTVNILLAVLAVTALAVAIAVAFRSLLAAAFAWSLTLATPLWLGMSHVDFKDMPVAAGLTLVTAGLILAFVLEPPRRATVAGGGLAGAGGALAVATRPASLLLVAGLVVGTAAVVLAWALARRRPRAALPVAVAACVAPVCGLALTWATNPIARIGGVRWLRDSIDVARDYPWDVGPIRTAGQNLRSVDLPWWYVPAWLGAQLPLLTLAAVVGGIALLAALLVRRRRTLDPAAAIPVVPIALQAIALPALIVASGAVLYDGIRHVLFVLPALIALAAVALAVLERRAGAAGRPWLALALPLAAVAIVATSLVASARWAPYAYAFLNPVAGRDKEHRAWELDYWGVSAREGLRRLREAGLTPLYVQPSQQPGVPWGAYNGPVTTGGRSGLYVFVRWDGAARYGCTVIFTIERGGHVLGEGARCPNRATFE
jgi:hypothetical protein